MKAKDVDTFERLATQLQASYNEMEALSKKKQDDAVNKFKLGWINKLLIDANKLLGTKNKPFSEFNTFNEEELPTNSDVVFMLSQYLNCLEKIRADNIESNYRHQWYWVIDDEISDIQTAPPRKIKE